MSRAKKALLRLMWIGVADGIDCDCKATGDTAPYCEAMRALGWGEHFNRKRFEQYVAAANPVGLL